MLRFLVDEDFDNRILRGLLRRQPDLDIVRVQDTHLSGEDDETILDWTFQEGRILLTHDASTMTDFAYQRMREGKSVLGIVEVPQWLGIGAAIEDILTIAMSCAEEEFENRIEFLPI